MADKKISELTAITGANTAADDELVIVDTSADETKKISRAELATALGSGAVDSVNGETGTVVLDADDISDTSTTNKYTTAGDISKLAGIEALADVTDATNVAAAGAAMLTGATFTGDVSFGDNDKAIFGDGSDLEISHNGSNSIIKDNGTGNLNLTTNGTYISLLGASGAQNMARFQNGGTVELYHNGNKKLNTTTTGVAVNGVLDATNGVQFGTTDSRIYEGADNQINFRIGADGPYGEMIDVGGNVMEFGNASGELALTAGGTERARLSSDGLEVTGELIATSYNETYDALSGTTPTVDCHDGNMFSLTTSGNTTFTFSNPPASGTAFGFTLKLVAGGTHTITYPASVDWAGGTAPDAPASGETDVLVFITHDGGTTWYGFRSGDAMA